MDRSKTPYVILKGRAEEAHVLYRAVSREMGVSFEKSVGLTAMNEDAWFAVSGAVPPAFLYAVLDEMEHGMRELRERIAQLEHITEPPKSEGDRG